MCLKLEKSDTKLFQFFPLRNDIVPKYISVDTKTIIELFVDKDKNAYLKDIKRTQKDLWDKYFNLDNKISKIKNHTFDYRILTDCYGVSIQFIHN